MTIKYYIIDAEHNVVEVPLLVWAEWFENITNRIVDYTEITSVTHVSTVFLGASNVLFETTIFGGPHDGDMWRYISWDDAVTGHKAAVRKAREAIQQKHKSRHVDADKP
jgi:hypothetical protein